MQIGQLTVASRHVIQKQGFEPFQPTVCDPKGSEFTHPANLSADSPKGAPR